MAETVVAKAVMRTARKEVFMMIKDLLVSVVKQDKMNGWRASSKETRLPYIGILSTRIARVYLMLLAMSGTKASM
jgi:hypothetical protein